MKKMGGNGFNNNNDNFDFGGAGLDTGLHEECGVFGIAGMPENPGAGPDADAAVCAYMGLFALQHRGQEACGIAVNDAGVISCRKGQGLLTDIFNEKNLQKLKGASAIGHVRYSTTGDSLAENAQPIAVSHMKGNLAIAHNGNLVNADALREEIELGGGIFHGTGDSEIIAYTIVRERIHSASIEEAVLKAMRRIKGAYSLLAMSPRKLIAARDPNGFRPLSIGMAGGKYIFASETCAIDAVGGAYLRDVEPGEVVVIEDGKLISIDSGLPVKKSFCSFEFIYFSRPDSIIGGIGVDWARREMGRALARENSVPADIVVAVPDSGLSAARGYSEESGLPNVMGLVKNRYIGRTFIQPTQGAREREVRLKLNPLSANVKGKRVVLIDDSIVRGTTSARIVSALREAGAAEVHLRSSAPPFRFPCYFGTDVPDQDALIAVGHTEKELAEMLGADSVGFLSDVSLSRILEGAGCPICKACFTGDYPIERPQSADKNIFQKPIRNL
ncbi:MAG: amidophosphoribosyltransferase [Clostridiales Family XIII bacterium]|jgi:amidophosphoribosyltransferase|nr:amidophosphoribosyltransferase [Clostridiales Family XIII bacterium]